METACRATLGTLGLSREDEKVPAHGPRNGVSASDDSVRFLNFNRGRLATMLAVLRRPFCFLLPCLYIIIILLMGFL